VTTKKRCNDKLGQKQDTQMNPGSKEIIRKQTLGDTEKVEGGRVMGARMGKLFKWAVSRFREVQKESRDAGTREASQKKHKI